MTTFRNAATPVLGLVFLIAIPLIAHAADRPALVRGGDTAVLHGGLGGAAKSEVDTVYILGGPGRWDGKFEDASGQPDWHGWTHRDETFDPTSYWQVSDHLPLAGPYSMWCGTIYDDGPGYGNDWRQYLVFTHVVSDPQQPSSVHWGGLLRTDTEPDYDFVYLEVNRAGEWEVLASYDGARTVTIDLTATLQPGEYSGPDGDQLQLRVFFASDGAWSDEDGLFTSDGACWVDELAVTVDGVLVDHEDFDDQDPGAWQQEIDPGVGDFAQLWLQLQDLDPCRSNRSVQVAFIDDGVVVPGTGGTECVTWCYGPGGYIVNNTGGLMGEGYYLHNAVESPVLDWPEGNDAIRFDFDVYRHEELGDFGVWPGIFYQWGVRSTSDPVNDPIGEKRWSARGFAIYGGPGYFRHREVVTDLMQPGRVQVQVRLACIEYGYVWGWVGTDGTPAPYFDNVAVLVWPYSGPALAGRTFDLANDGFPASGALDLENLATNSVRFDMAQNIALAEHGHIDPGDSVVVNVAVVQAGAELARLPRMYVRMRANPLFNPYRALPANFSQAGDFITGYVEGDTARSGEVVHVGRYAFDLPDTGFFYPGDVIHYFIEAGDVLASQQRWATLPADTTGFSDFGPLGKYNRHFVVRALPTVSSDVPGHQPEILFWDDAGDDEAFQRWRLALANLGLTAGEGHDLYVTRAASSGLGNGLGGRATAAQLAGYRTLVYTSGDLSTHVLGNGDFDGDPSDDLGVLTDWLALGDRNLLLSGNNVVRSLRYGAGPEGLAFLGTYLPVELVAMDVKPYISGQASPTIAAVPGNGVIVRADRYVAYGGCMDLPAFDAVLATGESERLAEFTDLNGDPGQYPYAAAVFHHDTATNARVVCLPYDLAVIRNAPGWTPPSGYAGIPARAIVLEDILDFFGMGWWTPPVDAETPDAPLAMACYPNPFNPTTTIALDLPRAADVRVRLYNLRGALVRVLADGRLAEGRHQLTWDGRDDDGNPVASGVYFVETRALQEVRLAKLTLVR